MSEVYFAYSAGSIKIGVTENVVKRMDELAGGCVAPVTLLCTIPGGRDVESRVHRRFAADRVHHEWFLPSPDIREFLVKMDAFRAPGTFRSIDILNGCLA